VVFSRKDIDFEVRDTGNNGTVLDYAANSGDPKIMSIVQGAKAAAEMETTARATEVEMSVENMMREAIGNGKKKMILKLLQHPDLNINFSVNENNFTFPMWAMMTKILKLFKRFSAVKILILRSEVVIESMGGFWITLKIAVTKR
jgi:hypothetical protein